MIKFLAISFLLISTHLQAETDFISDVLFKNQWGVVNTGQKIRRSSGLLTRDYVTGIPGVDINWDRLEGRKIDPEREIIVAVIDSGLDLNHPDLEGRVWEDPLCQSMTSDERLRFPCFGVNFLAKKNGEKRDLRDTTGHGTFVAGLIAANIDNEGTVGVTVKNIKIMPLKVLNKNVNRFRYGKRMVTDIIADAIAFAVEKKAHIINLSLGWPKIIETERLKKSLQMAERAGILIVVAAGNNNKNVPVYPCSNRGIICVGAIDNTGKLAKSSNFGGKVDILAPGEGIISILPRKLESRALRIGGYELKSGTSQASPFVSAIAASIRLVHPDATLDEVKARLLSSARKNENSVGQRKSSKYGPVDMKKALGNLPQHFVSPDYKGILEVQFDGNGQAHFNLPVKSYISDIGEIEVKIKMSGHKKAAQFIKNDFGLRLLKGETKNIRVGVSLIDGTADSHGEMEVTIKKSGKILHASKTLLVFSRGISDHKGLIEIPLKTVDPKAISIFKGRRKTALVKYVFDKFNKFEGQEIYYVNKKLQSKERTVLTVLKIKDASYSKMKLEIPTITKLLSIFKVDINLDGKMDYFIYTMNQKKKELLFSLRDHEGKELYKGKSDWVFPISAFEGLPLVNGFEANFSWLKVKTKGFGEIMLPAVAKEWSLPKEDNTDDVLDRLPNSREMRIYYLLPNVGKDGGKGKNKVNVSVRTVIDFDFSSFITKKFDLKPSERFSIQKPFIQTEEEEQKGEIRTVLAVGREFRKKYYLLTFKDEKTYTISPMKVERSYIERNSVFPLKKLGPLNRPGQSAVFMALNNQSEARISVIDNEGEAYQIKKKSESWSDPYFSYLGGYQTDTGPLFFLESRHNVYALDHSGKTQTLPVKRESSFPGLQFTELMEDSIAEHNGAFLPAIYINSTQVFGEKLYLMVHDGDEFKRPINTSLKIPKRCIALQSGRHGKKGYHFQFLCKESSGEMSIKLVPFKY